VIDILDALVVPLVMLIVFGIPGLLMSLWVRSNERMDRETKETLRKGGHTPTAPRYGGGMMSPSIPGACF
jgi:hypothetical protein